MSDWHTHYLKGNVGDGWWSECSCGWESEHTFSDPRAAIGEHDDHLEDVEADDED